MTVFSFCKPFSIVLQ